MEKQPIYINNFELAMKMKMAGFDKECSFRAVNYSFYEPVTRKNYDHLHILYGYIKTVGNRYFIPECFIEVVTYYFSPACFSGSEETLYLPTLGEIDLPEGVYVAPYKIDSGDGGKNTVFYCFDNNKRLFVKKLSGGRIKQKYFETELEARAHAWLWANQEKEVKNEK
jgi:hypothetical protein